MAMTGGLISEHVIHDGVSIHCNNTDTMISGWNTIIKAGGYDGTIKNVSGDGQTLVVWLESRWGSSSSPFPLVGVNEGQLFAPLADGEERPFFVEASQLRQVRIMARYSGAGGNVIVSDKHTYSLG